MKDCRQFYIDGKWVAATTPRDFDVISPVTEEKIATISLGSASDVDKAVAAAKRAFETYGETSVEERLALLRKIIEVYQSKMELMAETISEEMGAPLWLAKMAQAPAGLAHFWKSLRSWEVSPSKRPKARRFCTKNPSGCADDYALELADEPNRLQSGASSGGGLHDGAETK